jgi:hypothetical protein
MIYIKNKRFKIKINCFLIIIVIIIKIIIRRIYRVSRKFIIHAAAGPGGKGSVIIITSMLYMINLRFYVILFYIAILTLIFRKKISILILVLLMFFVGLYFDLLNIFISLFNTGASYVNINLVYLPYDMFHFWLTPRPFYEDSIHGFLLYANIFNWFSFPFIIYGFFTALFSKNLFLKYIAYYYLLFTIFYGLVDYLNGPRHRIQLLFATILFLWIGLSNFRLLKIKYRLKIAQQ